MESVDKFGLWVFGILATAVVAISLIGALASKPVPQKPCGCSCSAQFSSQTEAPR